jgi:hypothetical protein
MGARPGAGSLINRASKGIRKGFSLLATRVRALCRAVRVDNIRLAQRLRVGLGLYLKHLEGPLRNDVGRLFEVSGLWVRNIGNRHQTKRDIQRISRRIIQRLHPLIAEAPRLLVEKAGPHSGSGAVFSRRPECKCSALDPILDPISPIPAGITKH